MSAPLDQSWIALAGMCLAGVLCGGVVRHFWGLRADRANADRVAALCDRLDAKDAKLHGIRAELQAEQARVRELRGALAARHGVGATAERTAAPVEVQPIRIGQAAHGADSVSTGRELCFQNPNLCGPTSSWQRDGARSAAG